MRVLLCIFLLCLSLGARAERVKICYAYDCNAQTEVNFNAAQMRETSRLFRNIRNAEQERAAVARAVGSFYRLAGTQSPIWQDHGGNEDDEDVQGRMDCIDHSTNTTAFLSLMQKRKWLRFHTVGERVERGVLNAHWGARLIEKSSGNEFVIDSWFFDPGEPAVVFTLEQWKGGARPDAKPAVAQKAAQ